MCIGFPGKVLSIDENNHAVIDIGGTRRDVCLDIIDEDVAEGDYVISHAGFAIHRIDEDMAHERLELLQNILSDTDHT